MVSGASLGAAYIIVSEGSRIKVFGGFRAQWTQVIWIIVMMNAVLSVPAVIVLLISDLGFKDLFLRVVGTIVCALSILVPVEIFRKQSRPIVQEVVEYLKARGD